MEAIEPDAARADQHNARPAPSEPDWKEIAHALYLTARTAGCRCEYERNGSGVPVWFKDDAGGIGRKLIKQCSRCVGIESYEVAAAERVAA
jgi:hypothetical protein